MSVAGAFQPRQVHGSNQEFQHGTIDAGTLETRGALIEQTNPAIQYCIASELRRAASMAMHRNVLEN